MSIQEFEIEFNVKSNNYTINSEKVVKEIHPNYEQLTITPSTEEQIREGSFNKVTVEPIEDLTEEITNQGELITEQETTIEDVIESLKNKAGLNIKLQEKTAIPNVEEQEITPDEEFIGLSKIIISGDENLVAENIKEGTSIFGVEGNVKATDVKITDASYLFYNGVRTDNLVEFLKLCTSVTSMMNMFYGCNQLTTLDLSSFDTSNVKRANYMFYNCSKLTTLDLSNFNTSNVINMNSMFDTCTRLTTLNLSSFDTSNVVDMQSIFSGCKKLTTLDLSSFDTSKLVNARYMFTSCNELTNLTFMHNLGKGFTQKSSNYSNYSLNLSSSNKLSYDSLIDVINNLYDLNLTYDVANGGTLYTQQVVIGSENISKLTADEIAIATNKGWVVS